MLASSSLAGLNIGAGLRYQGSTVADSPNDVDVDGFTVADAAVSSAWNKFTLRLRGDNIFDEEYVCSCTSTDARFFGATLPVAALLYLGVLSLSLFSVTAV